MSYHLYTCAGSRGVGNMSAYPRPMKIVVVQIVVDKLSRSVMCWKYIYAQLEIWIYLFQGEGSDYHIEVNVKMDYCIWKLHSITQFVVVYNLHSERNNAEHLRFCHKSILKSESSISFAHFRFRCKHWSFNKTASVREILFLAHLSRRLIWLAYRIGRPLSSVVCRTSYIVVRRPHSLKIFSSETNGPIKVKFHMELLWDRGTKVCSNGPGHLTKMAAMPIYGKN